MANARHAPPPFPTSSTRRDTQHSVSSTHSSRSDSVGSQASSPVVETAVTRLLVAIKELLESLSQWSTGKTSEGQVSDVYVNLGNGFNEAVAAFASYGIDMSELSSVPEDLRDVLEQCLSEDATPENLEIYLPTVRHIITNLLQGLRMKQSAYRKVITDRRRRASEQSSSGAGERESRAKQSRREGERGHRSQLSKNIGEDDPPVATPTARDSITRRGAISSVKRRDPRPQTPPSVSENEPQDGGLTSQEDTVSSTSRRDRTHISRRTPQPSVAPPTYLPPNHPLPIQPSLSEEIAATLFTPSSSNQTPSPSLPPPSQVPASVKRYSLVDKPISTSTSTSPSPPPTFAIDEPLSPVNNHDPKVNGTNGTDSSPPGTPPTDVLQVPAMASSLLALKKSDTLERRASKRFSSYTFAKMTGGTGAQGRPGRSNSKRRSLAATNASLTTGELAVLAEEEAEESPSEQSAKQDASPQSPRNRTRSSSRSALIREPFAAMPVPLPPPLPRTSPEPPPVSYPPAVNGAVANNKPVVPPPETRNVIAEEREALEPPNSFPVFLQLGREVKKVTIEPGLSIASLRILFVDKFSYNPGLESFPAIYIRDPSSGVQYELEDVDEVKEKCLLFLNIEPLDQIKQHIDTQISLLSRDIKDLRTAVANNRHSFQAQPIITNPAAESTPAPPRPTDRHFQTVARRLSRLVNDSGASFGAQTGAAAAPPAPPASAPVPSVSIFPQATGQSALQVQNTGGSVLSEYSNRVMADLKTQFDEVQNLRRDIGIMRQLYSGFAKSTKESLEALRGQTLAVKRLANTGVGGARAYIDSGKKQLDGRSQNVLTKVEELQDMVEGIKDDVLKRHVTPKPQLVKRVKEDVQTIAEELESLKEHLKTIQPMWKKTWAEELQNVVEEQQFLKHQEDFLNDLLEDHAAVVEVFGHVEKVISIRGTGSGRAALRARGFRPAVLPDEGQAGLNNVMLEIRSAAVDPDKRMKAIVANQKNREKELATRSNELQAELTDFVGGRKLKLTGGAEEAERVRQKRSEQTMKAMFGGGGGDAPS